MGQDQKLHHEFSINHAPHTVLKVKRIGSGGVGCAHFVAHGNHLAGQGLRVSGGTQNLATHGFKRLTQALIAHTKPRPRHRLVLPNPSGIGAALTLVIGKRFPRSHQQASTAIGAQGSVDFIHITLTGFDGEPLNELAGKSRVNLPCLRVIILVDKDDIEVAAVAQFLAAPFAIAQHSKTRQFTVAHFQPRPNPQGGDLNQGVGQQT